MTQSTVAHGTFTLEREYAATPERVFAAWTTAEAKRAWFVREEGFIQSENEYSLDFRVGGAELLDAQLVSGNRLVVVTVFQDIVENERIVATYDILLNDRRMSVSVYSVVLEPTAKGTRLVTTEHGAFLDNLDTNEQRRLGAESNLDLLGKCLDQMQAPAAVA
jgi:uncharacterized protein YndB with AHSA1/START domain